MRQFLASKNGLAVLVGQSGFGKTTLGVRLLQTWTDDYTSLLLIKGKQFCRDELESQLFACLGITGSDYLLGVLPLEHWLRQNGRRLVVFVDGLNEFSSDLKDCIRLFRNIVRFAFFLPELPALKLIVTVRQDTWIRMLPLIDRVQLERALRNEYVANESYSPITLDRFTIDELDAALRRLSEANIMKSRLEDFRPAAIEQLRDPFILAVTSELGADASVGVPAHELYRRVVEHKLKVSDLSHLASPTREGLASLALGCFVRRDDRFRHQDVLSQLPTIEDPIRSLKDIGIIVDADQGFLRFSHDRLQEYFLSQSLSTTPGSPPLDSVAELRMLLDRSLDDQKMYAAVRLFLEQNQKQFHIVEGALGALKHTNAFEPHESDENVFVFGKRVLLSLAESATAFTAAYLTDAITHKILSLWSMAERLSKQQHGFPPRKVSPCCLRSSITRSSNSNGSKCIYRRSRGNVAFPG